MKNPTISSSAFVADNATVRGDVTLGERSSVFFGAVLGEYQSMTEYPLAAAASLSDIVLFKRLDGIASAVWLLAAAFRCGVMLFSLVSILGECRRKEESAWNV